MRMLKVIGAAGGVLIGAAGVVVASGDAPRVHEAVRYFEQREAAFGAFDERNWRAAAAGLEGLTGMYGDDSAVWQALGESELRRRRYGRAAAALERALALGGTNPQDVCYDVAVCRAGMGDADGAFEWLGRALDRGFESREYIRSDPALRSLRGDARWPSVAGAGYGGDDRVVGWRSDLEYYRSEIERLHVASERSVSMEEVHAAIDALSERIGELDDRRIPAQLQRIARMLGSGHSVVYPVCTRVALTELPVELYWFPEGLYIIDAGRGYEQWIGCRVEAIGRGRCGSFASDLEPIVTRDNATGILWFGPKYLKMTSFLLDMGYLGSVDRVPVTVETASGELEAVEFEPVPVALENPRLRAPREVAPPRFLSWLDEHYWEEDLGGGVMYVQFNQVHDRGRETLEGFALRLREELRGNGARDLILDLRHNNGGNPALLPEFLRTLVWFEAAREGNRVYVLIGRNTFSGAQNFLNDIDRLTHAVLVGEASGSRPNMVGQTSEVVLPWSGVRLSIGSRLFQDSFPGDERAWIAPDVPVELTSGAYFAGRDPVMETVMELIRRERE